MQKYEVGMLVVVDGTRNSHQKVIGEVVRVTKSQVVVSHDTQFRNKIETKFYIKDGSEVGKSGSEFRWRNRLYIKTTNQKEIDAIKGAIIRSAQDEYASSELKTIAFNVNYLTDSQIEKVISFIGDVYKKNIKDGKWFKPEG